MREAFHQSARLQFVTDRQYSVWSLDEYLGKLPGRPADDESDRTRRVVRVQASGDMATAEVELDYPATRFVDHLTLLRIDGQWLIVNKAFQAFPKSQEQLRPTPRTTRRPLQSHLGVPAAPQTVRDSRPASRRRSA